MNESNAAAIAQVCHRLDGIPLAVELAAARCRHLSIEQIAGELDDRFRLLTGGSRMVMPRQQTLLASVEWSYELLDDVERRVLRRLGVFAGPFSLEAAEAVVAASGDVDPITVFDTISRLVDKSLVLADDPDSATPYRLLETIRAFAIQRARESGELTALRDSHAAWWCTRLEGLGVTGPTDDVVALVDAHHDDLVAALTWAAERDVELGLRLLWPLARGSREPDGPATPCPRSTCCWRPPSSSNTPSTGCAQRSPPPSRCSASAVPRPSPTCSPDANHAPSTSTTRTARPSPAG